MQFFGIVFLAIIVEGVISYGKMIFVDRKVQWQIVAAIVLGVVVAIAYAVDLLAIVGMITTIPYLGCILTGILISRGSNYVFDLLKLVQNAISNLKGGTN